MVFNLPFTPWWLPGRPNDLDMAWDQATMVAMCKFRYGPTKQTAVINWKIPLRVTKSGRSQEVVTLVYPAIDRVLYTSGGAGISSTNKNEVFNTPCPPKYRGSPPLPTSLQNPCIHTLSWHFRLAIWRTITAR